MMMQKQSTMQLRSPTGVRPLVQRRPCTKAAAQAQAKSGLAKVRAGLQVEAKARVFACR